MTTTDTRRLYRVQLPTKGWRHDKRALYDGHAVWADLGGPRDSHGAISVLFDSGPLVGEERWLSPDRLVPWASSPTTENEW